MKVNMNFAENGKNFVATLKETAEQLGVNMGADDSTTDVTMGTPEKHFNVSMRDDNKTFSVSMGEGGSGTPGAPGKDGEDGFSPIVDLTATDAGVDITVTDAEGTKTATVRNGKDGRDGVDGKDGKDGQIGPQGPAGSAGPQGPAGDNGKDGQDGFSPVVAVQDISGGHRVTITDKDGEKQFDVMDGKDGEGGTGGGGSAIVEAVEAPETDARKDVFFRITTGDFHWGGEVLQYFKCIVVDVLPEEGDSAVNAEMTLVTIYYAKDNGTANGYVPDWLGAYTGVPSGWYPAEMIIQVLGREFGGIVKDENQIQEEGLIYLLIKESVIYRNNDKWNDIHGAAVQGDGALSVVLNTPLNKANASNSTAKGYQTIANGEASSAEGFRTVATGKAQHVQGMFNKIDEDIDEETSFGRYIFIVGNGYGETYRSNAHTIDWGGNAWYQGTVECKGILLTSPNGTKYKITVNDDGSLNAAKA